MGKQLDSSPVADETLLDIALATVDIRSQVLSNLALSLEKNHHDRWLTAFLQSNPDDKAVAHLRAAMKANHDGRPMTALDEARIARRLYRHSGNIGGAARSQFEIIYSLQRQSIPNRCLLEIARFNSLLKNASFRWLEIQARLESASCEGMLARFDLAWRETAEAVRQARQFNYSTLALRALGFQAALASAEGRVTEAWLIDESGLKLFWEGSSVVDRGYQFLSDLEISAEQQGRWRLALALEDEIIDLLPELNRNELSALAHFTSGSIRQSLDDGSGAEQEFKTAGTYFERMPKSAFSQLYRNYGEISLASLELHRGDHAAARHRLEGVRSSMPPKPTFTLMLSYWKAMAELARFSNNMPEEEGHLQQIIAIAGKGAKSLDSAADRWAWDREVGPAYRRLLQIQLSRPHDPLQALADWETYRLRQTKLGGDNLNTIQGRIAVARSRTMQLHHDTVISFAVFDNEIVSWEVDDRGIQEHRRALDIADLQRQVQAFRIMCSDPSSPLEKVKSSGSRLYKVLFGPLQGQLDAERTLFIESDGPLSMVPWSALTMEDGRYFADAFTAVSSPGLFYPKPKADKVEIKRALVAEPGGITFDGVRYTPLPQAKAEAAFVVGLYPGSVFLPEAESNTRRILQTLPSADLFHFAGHAASHEYGGELVIRNGQAGDLITALQISKLSLRKTTLVVLSACSTAGQRDSGRDPNGLVWAFLQAGAGRVLATRWDVDSATTGSLIQRFYKGLSTQSIPDSLRTSQAQLRRLSKTSHPYYWSSFEVFGNIN